MSILINGIPKHGTHALLKVVELLGVPIAYKGCPGAELVHMIHYGESVDAKHIFTIRHPKNAFISWMRHYGLPLTSGYMQSRLQNMQQPECSYTDMCAPFVGWFDDPATLVVRYEDIISRAETITKIAHYLGVPDQPDVIKNLPGHTLTWQPVHSDYTTLGAWDADVEKVWQAIGGNELMQVLGYAG